MENTTKKWLASSNVGRATFFLEAPTKNKVLALKVHVDIRNIEPLLIFGGYVREEGSAVSF